MFEFDGSWMSLQSVASHHPIGTVIGYKTRLVRQGQPRATPPLLPPNLLHRTCGSIRNRIMDRLPLELAWLVYEHLEEFDLAPTPCSKFTEEPTDRLVYGNNDMHQHAGRNSCWMKLNDVSRADILNARQASSVFYDSSHKTFAKLLTDRTFRLTEVGFRDLILITRKKGLLQHIRTLTFGCATFRRNMGVNESGFVWPCTFLAGLNMQDRARLAAAYVQCRDWQHDNMEAHTRGLAWIFRALPNLDSIRMLTVDHVFHLGGWLKPGDEDLLHKDHYLYQDRSSEALSQHYQPKLLPRMYNNESSVVRDCIMEAMKLSELTLRDFRADPKPPVFDILQARLFTPALHTLRLVLSKDDIIRLDLSQWSSLLNQATRLQDLSLGIDSRCSSGENYNLRRLTNQAPITDRLFQALQHHDQLRRIELFSGWAFSEAALINFMADHSDTLRCFILSEPLLFGSWQRVLRAVARTTYGKTGFLKVRSPMESPSVGVWPVIPSEVDWQASSDFSYPIVWVTEP